MSPVKKKAARKAKKSTVDNKRRAAAGKKETPKAEILRTAHVHRARAHAGAATRRHQGRRDSK
jgi:hypothetical protein